MSNHQRHGIKTLNRLYDGKRDDYEQLLQMSYMVLGAGVMLDPISAEAQELETLRQKIEERISTLGTGVYEN